MVLKSLLQVQNSGEVLDVNRRLSARELRDALRLFQHSQRRVDPYQLRIGKHFGNRQTMVAR